MICCRSCRFSCIARTGTLTRTPAVETLGVVVLHHAYTHRSYHVFSLWKHHADSLSLSVEKSCDLNQGRLPSPHLCAVWQRKATGYPRGWCYDIIVSYITNSASLGLSSEAPGGSGMTAGCALDTLSTVLHSCTRQSSNPATTDTIGRSTCRHTKIELKKKMPP